jgi:hypothetical protein
VRLLGIGKSIKSTLRGLLIVAGNDTTFVIPERNRKTPEQTVDGAPKKDA